MSKIKLLVSIVRNKYFNISIKYVKVLIKGVSGNSASKRSNMEVELFIKLKCTF